MRPIDTPMVVESAVASNATKNDVTKMVTEIAHITATLSARNRSNAIRPGDLPTIFLFGPLPISGSPGSPAPSVSRFVAVSVPFFSDSAGWRLGLYANDGSSPAHDR